MPLIRINFLLKLFYKKYKITSSCLSTMPHKISLTTHFTLANNISKYKKLWLQMNTNRGSRPFAIKSPSLEKLPNTSVNTIHYGFSPKSQVVDNKHIEIYYSPHACGPHKQMHSHQDSPQLGHFACLFQSPIDMKHKHTLTLGLMAFTFPPYMSSKRKIQL